MHTLADWNGDEPAVRPVEVNFANVGSFTKPHPFDADSITTNDLHLGLAFPTTGSMLLLMRHANRSLDEFTRTKELAFTTWLDDVTKVMVNTGVGVTEVPITEHTQIDNGRIPVFDVGVEQAGAPRQYAHHVSPAIDQEADPTKVNPAACGPGTFDPNNTCNRPGRLMHLPWGQLVFDYFTVLPLSSLGPYANPLKDPSFVVDLNAPPRVDMTGLRVHGRIDLNAAPWKVLSGLPKIPAWRLPQTFRAQIGAFAQLDMTPNPPPGGLPPAQPVPIGDQLAQAIVAYREAREVVPPAMQGPPVNYGRTGDYRFEEYDALGSPIGGGRGWNSPTPSYRRGTGFLTVGELANVRYQYEGPNPPGPVFPGFRIDGSELDAASPDFVKATAKLVALADWETVRSHVFTVYGTLRGDVDLTIAGTNANETARLQADDVDRRAIRFQETLDRLPTFLGSQSPQSVGRPVVAKYIDARGD